MAGPSRNPSNGVAVSACIQYLNEINYGVLSMGLRFERRLLIKVHPFSDFPGYSGKTHFWKQVIIDVQYCSGKK